MELTAIDHATLASLIAKDDVVVIDVRSFKSFGKARIQGALRVLLSGLLMRRLANGKIPLDDVIVDDADVWKKRKTDTIVCVYDERSSDEAAPYSAQNPLHVVTKSLQSQGITSVFLSGGFNTFSQHQASFVVTGEPSCPTGPQKHKHPQMHGQECMSPAPSNCGRRKTKAPPPPLAFPQCANDASDRAAHCADKNISEKLQAVHVSTGGPPQKAPTACKKGRKAKKCGIGSLVASLGAKLASPCVAPTSAQNQQHGSSSSSSFSSMVPQTPVTACGFTQSLGNLESSKTDHIHNPGQRRIAASHASSSATSAHRHLHFAANTGQLKNTTPTTSQSQSQSLSVQFPSGRRSRSQHQCVLTAPVSKVTKSVYIGSERDAKDLSLLRSLGITHVVNVTEDIENHHEASASLSYFRIPIRDTWNQRLREFFPEAFKFIDEAVRSGGRVLVHCRAGVSRSPAVVIGYIMHSQQLPLKSAHALVREKREIINPNLDFMGELKEYEALLVGPNLLPQPICCS